MTGNRSWPDDISRPAIAALKAYSARGGATEALHLDANESPWAPPPGGSRDNRYPEQQPPALRDRLARIYGVSAEQVMIGRGADEAIDVLMRTFCEAGEDKILICPPTFGYFRTAANVQGAEVVEVPLDERFQWDEDALLARLAEGDIKIAFLCSPNNPTGNSLSAQVIAKACTATTGLVVVDEAYIEFSPHDTAIGMMADHRNLVITRTLSKVYGLAGVRLGCAVAHPDVIALMLKVLPPYPLPRPVIAAGLRALAPPAMAVHDARLNVWLAERARLAEMLPASPYVAETYPSDANFILFRSRDPNAMLAALDRAGVRLRDFRTKIADHFRISIGTPEENDIALAALGIGASKTRPARTGEAFRRTNETDIAIRVDLDRPGDIQVTTGNGFFDHMLEQVVKHGGFSAHIACNGDLEIDAHHTVEDVALAFGTALNAALGDKAGAGRYGFTMPMDETQARVAVDLSGRPSFRWQGEFPTDHVGDFPAEMCPHFFQSLSQTLRAAIQIDVDGENTHHMIEACFKGVGRALRPAFAVSGAEIASTKGVL